MEDERRGEPEVVQHRFPCARCGALLRFTPGTGELGCEHCGHRNAIPDDGRVVREVDLASQLRARTREGEEEERRTVECSSCGARTTLEAYVTAASCPFCGTDVVLSEGEVERELRPHGLLPFAVGRAEARNRLSEWVKSRWLAPGEFKRWARAEDRGLVGVYIPHWTFDTLTETDYRGQRGEYYWETETYTTTDSEGNRVTKTRQVRKTRWYPARGTVWNRFDDVLVMASRSLPPEEAGELEPWDLGQVTPYRPEYVSGFRAESHQVDLEEGFEMAAERMQGPIRASVRRDIGGDTQRIGSLDTRYHETTFKYLLLPVWLGTCRYRDRAWRVVVNARTGEVRGERPWSGWKIAGLVLLVAVVVAAIWYGAQL